MSYWIRLVSFGIFTGWMGTCYWVIVFTTMAIKFETPLNTLRRGVPD